MTMRLSVFSDETGLDIERAAALVKEWGLDCIDLRGRLFQQPLEQLSDERLHELKALLDGRGLRVACLQSSLGKVHLPEGERLEREWRKLERLESAARILDCRLVRSFFFWQPPNGQECAGIGDLAVRPDVLSQVLERFLPLARHAQQAGLTLAFENCGCTKEECFRMLDALDIPGWGFAWDPKNSWMHDRQEREHDLDGYLRRLARRAICLHVKSTGSIWFADGFDPIPYERVLQALDDEGFNGPVSVETHNYDPALSAAEATQRVLAVVRKALPSAAPGAQQERCAVSAATVTRPYADRPVRFGVVGLGMGHNRAEEMTQTPGVRLVQVCDLRLDRCRRTSEKLAVPYTQDFGQMLANPEVEAVMVMNETGRHGDLALQALAAGKHVLVTKPMEMSVRRCEEMMRLAQERGLLLGVDHCRRLRPSTQSLRAAVETGALGRPLHANVSLRIRRTMDYFHENGAWRGTRALDGGVLSNQTIHHLDELLFAFGLPERVRCDAWTQSHDIEMEDLGLAVWQYASGLVVSIQATTSYPQSSWYYQLELHGTDGAYLHREGGPETAPSTRYFLQGHWTDSAPVPRECPWLNSMDSFASALRCGTPLLTTAQEGLAAVRMIQAMYVSAYERNGAWVNLDQVP